MPQGVYQRTGKRVKWTDDQIEKIAARFVELRLAHPFENTMPLINKAQHQVLDAEYHRTLMSLQASPPLEREILRQFRLVVQQASTSHEPPAPQIFTLEIPRKLTTQEMLREMDEPTLVALLEAKRLEREIRHQELLYKIASKAGAEDIPKVKEFVPHFDVFESAKKRTPIIAVVGAPKDTQTLLAAQVNTAKLDVNLRYPDNKDFNTVSCCDFAIIIRQNGKDFQAADRTIGELGRERVILMDTLETTAILQRVRDICSRQ